MHLHVERTAVEGLFLRFRKDDFHFLQLTFPEQAELHLIAWLPHFHERFELLRLHENLVVEPGEDIVFLNARFRGGAVFCDVVDLDSLAGFQREVSTQVIGNRPRCDAEKRDFLFLAAVRDNNAVLDFHADGLSAAELECLGFLLSIHIDGDRCSSVRIRDDGRGR